MEHSFDTNVAQEYGIPCAILLRHLYFWIEKNKANERHYYDNYYWTYSSVKALTELFPYMSKNTIVRGIQKLVDDGLLIEGNFNKSSYDRTKWYALTDLGYSICEKSEIHLPKFRNGNTQSQKPIPDILTDTMQIKNKQSNKLDCSSHLAVEQFAKKHQTIVDEWNSLTDVGIKPIRGITEGSQRDNWLKTRIRQYGEDAIIDAIKEIRDSSFLQGNNRQGWMITFDWFIRPNNFPKVLEGNYRDKSTGDGHGEQITLMDDLQ